jgi:undecaprenyl-diphosphatase
MVVLGLVVVAAPLLGSAAAPHSSRSGCGSDSSTCVESGTPTAPNTLTTPKAIVLGAVEGLTEYLPVSSTGHLLVAERLMGIGEGADKAATDTFTVVIQIGAILAVLGLYRRRFGSMIEGLVGRSAEGRTSLGALIIAFIPAAIIGQLFGDKIKDHLLNPGPVAAAWLAGSIAIFVFVAIGDRLRVTTESVSAMTMRQALIIGLAQVLALWPGTSRSLVTILAALAVGLSLSAAVEFSFLLGFVTLSAATGYELLKNGNEMIDTFGWKNPIIGIVVAGIAAVISVKWMVAYLQHRSLAIFGWYRIAAGLATIGLILAGTI